MEKNDNKKKGLKDIFEEMDIKKKKKTKPTKPKFTDMNDNLIIGIGKDKYNKYGSSSNDFKGLNNLGNICYSNVVMQCLISLKEFMTMLNSINKKIEHEDDIDKLFPIFHNVLNIMNYYNMKNTSLASSHINAIVNIFDYTGEQNDAHEFMVFLFDKLNDEILSMSSKYPFIKQDEDSTKNDETEWEEVKKGGKRMKQVNTISNFQISIIGQIFQGVLKHELESKGKSLSKCSIEPFFILSLDFEGNSIDECFSKFFSKRKIK